MNLNKLKRLLIKHNSHSAILSKGATIVLHSCEGEGSNIFRSTKCVVGPCHTIEKRCLYEIHTDAVFSGVDLNLGLEAVQTFYIEFRNNADVNLDKRDVLVYVKYPNSEFKVKSLADLMLINWAYIIFISDGGEQDKT
mgnify:FL=1